MRLIFSVKDLKDAIFRLNTFLDLKTSSTGTLLSINVLDIFSLLQGTLVGAQSLLGKFVNALVGSGSTGFDHIQNSAFIGTQSSNLTGNFAANQSSLGGGLTKAATTRMQCERRRSRYDDFVTCVQKPGTYSLCSGRFGLQLPLGGSLAAVLSLCVSGSCHGE